MTLRDQTLWQSQIIIFLLVISLGQGRLLFRRQIAELSSHTGLHDQPHHCLGGGRRNISIVGLCQQLGKRQSVVGSSLGWVWGVG